MNRFIKFVIALSNPVRRWWNNEELPIVNNEKPSSIDDGVIPGPLHQSEEPIRITDPSGRRNT